MKLTKVLFSISLAQFAAHAQTLVSPVQATTVEGSHANTMPWSSAANTRRYQQIHSDLGNTPRAFHRLSFRQDGTSNGHMTALLRMNLEMYMGHSVPYDRVSQSFAANYNGPRTTAIARRALNFGPVGPATPPGPNPFVGMDLVLDAPFAYDGARSLLWEIAMYSSGSDWGWVNTDMDGSSSSTPTNGATTGAGCRGMVQWQWTVDVAGMLGLTFAGAGAPSGAQYALAIGTSNPNMAIPGLCSNLLTSLEITLPLGSATATGEMRPENAHWYFRNTMPGAVFYSQLHAADPASGTQIPVRNSSGARFVVPSSDLSKVVRVSRLYVQDLTSTRSEWFHIGTIGFGVVTQFTY